MAVSAPRCRVDDLILLSVIIPCHNEAVSIEPLLHAVLAQLEGRDIELIVVDDGSTDGTSEEASSVPSVKIVRLEKNQGKGVALQKGIEAAGGDILFLMDGDGQDDPADIIPMLDEIEKGAAFVNGSKFIGSMEPGAISRINYYGNRFMSFLINILFNARITDSQSGFRAIKRSVLDGWRLDSIEYEIETEMLCKALKAKVEVREVAVTRKPRTGGATGFQRYHNGWRVMMMIFKERLNN